jgi:amidase
MNRRKFLRNTALAGFTLSTLSFGACQTGILSLGRKKNGLHGVDSFELNELTIQELQKKMASGEYTALDLTEMYLERIAAIDKSGPGINSVIEVNPDALALAEALDKEREAGKVRGPLHGIPVLIKDNIDTADKMMTTAGSLALAGNRARQDAFLVRKLRDAGAVLLGKTNLSEWANFRSTRSSSGWSSRGGQTRNPYVLDRNPCGSSSGSGAAVAANLCAVAIGTETDGSIVCPASVNGVVGLKPTVGLVSRTGIIPISETQDTAGPMARTVRDAVLLLGVISGEDAADARTQESRGKGQRDYTSFLDANGLQGKRIGIEKSFLKKHESVDGILLKALDLMKSKGAILVEIEIKARMRPLSGDEFEVLQYEFKDGVNKYLAKANAPVRSLQEVIDFNKAHAAQTMPFFQQEILESSQAKGGLDTPAYQEKVKKNLLAAREAIDSILKEHQLDAISGPTYGPSWCTDLVNGDGNISYGLAGPAAIAGYPHITVPLGLAQGLPVGLSFFGTAYSEPELIRIAFAYEQASKNRVAPKFLPSVGLPLTPASAKK